MARTVASGSESASVTVWWTNSFVIGAYFWLFLRIDSSAPHSLRVTIGGSATLALALPVVVVVLPLVVDDVVEPPLAVVVVDDDDDEAASALRSSPPSGGGLSPDPDVLPAEERSPDEVDEVVAVEDDVPAARTGVPVATRLDRGPWIVSMARIST